MCYVFLCGIVQLGTALCVHLVFVIDKTAHRQCKTQDILKLFLHIYYIETIHIFKTEWTDLFL